MLGGCLNSAEQCMMYVFCTDIKTASEHLRCVIQVRYGMGNHLDAALMAKLHDYRAEGADIDIFYFVLHL